MIEITAIKRIQDFRNLKYDWNSLLSKSGARNIFLTWEWLSTWWEVYGKAKRLQILLAKENGKLIGIAPLCSRKKKILGLVPMEEIEFMGTGAVASDHLDFIVEKGKEKEVVDAFLDHYSRQRNWDRMQLDDIRDGSKTIDVLRSYFNAEKLELYVTTAHVCPYITLPNSWDDYLKTLSRRTRENIRRRMKAFTKKMNGEFHECKDDTSTKKAFSRLIELHQMKWTTQGKLGSFGTERLKLFHERFIERFHRDGIIKLHVLEINGDIAAVYYSFMSNNILSFYSTGFDPKWSKHAPGTALLGMIIKQAIKEGLSEFDFLRGESDYKYRWTKLRRINRKVVASRRGYKKFLFRLERDGKNFLRKLARLIFPRRFYMKLQRMRDFRKLS